MNKRTALMGKSALGALLLAAVLFLAAILFPARLALALPPRPDPTPASPPIVGGGIELRAYTAQAVDWESVYTLVQWQDGLGGWNDIDGWRGTLDELYADGGRKTWFVPKAHFGTGPFRWVVYQGQEMLATSDPFDMPENDGQLVRSIVALP